VPSLDGDRAATRGRAGQEGRTGPSTTGEQQTWCVVEVSGGVGRESELEQRGGATSPPRSGRGSPSSCAHLFRSFLSLLLTLFSLLSHLSHPTRRGARPRACTRRACAAPLLLARLDPPSARCRARHVTSGLGLVAADVQRRLLEACAPCRGAELEGPSRPACSSSSSNLFSSLYRSAEPYRPSGAPTRHFCAPCERAAPASEPAPRRDRARALVPALARRAPPTLLSLSRSESLYPASGTRRRVGERAEVERPSVSLQRAGSASCARTSKPLVEAPSSTALPPRCTLRLLSTASRASTLSSDAHACRKRGRGSCELARGETARSFALESSAGGKCRACNKSTRCTRARTRGKRGPGGRRERAGASEKVKYGGAVGAPQSRAERSESASVVRLRKRRGALPRKECVKGPQRSPRARSSSTESLVVALPLHAQARALSLRLSLTQAHSTCPLCAVAVVSFTRVALRPPPPRRAPSPPRPPPPTPRRPRLAGHPSSHLSSTRPFTTSSTMSLPPSRRPSFAGTPLAQPPSMPSSRPGSAAPSRRGSFALSVTEESPENSRPGSTTLSRRSSFAASPLFRRSSTAGQIPPEGLRRKLEGLNKVPPSLGEIGQRPSSFHDRDAVQNQETEFVGCVEPTAALSLPAPPSCRPADSSSSLHAALSTAGRRAAASTSSTSGPTSSPTFRSSSSSVRRLLLAPARPHDMTSSKL